MQWREKISALKHDTEHFKQYQMWRENINGVPNVNVSFSFECAHCDLTAFTQIKFEFTIIGFLCLFSWSSWSALWKKCVKFHCTMTTKVNNVLKPKKKRNILHLHHPGQNRCPMNLMQHQPSFLAWFNQVFSTDNNKNQQENYNNRKIVLISQLSPQILFKYHGNRWYQINQLLRVPYTATTKSVAVNFMF